MASICPSTFPSSARTSDPNPHKLSYAYHNFTTTSRFNSRPTYSSTRFSHSLSRVSDSSPLCRCHNNNDNNNGSEDEVPWQWDSALQENFRNVIKWIDDYVTGYRKHQMGDDTGKKGESGGAIKRYGEVVDGDGGEEWDWERWKRHFVEVDEQERVVSILKSQLKRAIVKEDYEDAARIKVAIAAAASNDTVGRVMSCLKKAVEEERYRDAAFVRDCASAGLVGWWAGLSDDSKDPYGRIIRISAEHGRYLARTYSPRQLAMTADGAPLFEVFLTMNEKGEYKHQAVYLERSEGPKDFPIASSKSSGLISSVNPLDPLGDKGDLFAKDIEDTDDGEDRDDDFDTAEDSGFENVLRDMIPGAKDLKIKVLNVTTPDKIDRDLISKVVEQIMEEEDEEEKDTKSDSIDDMKDGTDAEQDDIDVDAGNTIIDGEGNGQIAIKVVVGGLAQKISDGKSHKDLIRVPAKLENKSRSSFTFSIQKEKQLDSSGNAQSVKNRDRRIRGIRSIDSVMLDLAKSIGRGKIPMKVLKDVGQLINLTLSQAQNRQPLSGSTTFNRIELPTNADPLNGLYVGAHGLYTSEVIHLRRKFGQWKEDGNMKGLSNLEFYEYVEAVKITGDPYVPAGQVAFRAKVGTKYQLPHKGIIPEEFGVIARYCGQGRLAEPGFQNPRWVDGELVILDGKYINGGPVVGFVYWAPEYHFLVFFNQLRLQE